MFRDVQAAFSSNYNIDEIVQVTEAQSVQNMRREEFIQIGENTAILRGTMHQGHHCFSETSRGKQCTVMAGVAIISKHLTDISSWIVILTLFFWRKIDTIDKAEMNLILIMIT